MNQVVSNSTLSGREPEVGFCYSLAAGNLFRGCEEFLSVFEGELLDG